ncbi:MAG: hypothetical protein WAV51_00185 [Microgenomates group bacterium]
MRKHTVVLFVDGNSIGVVTKNLFFRRKKRVRFSFRNIVTFMDIPTVLLRPATEDEIVSYLAVLFPRDPGQSIFLAAKNQVTLSLIALLQERGMEKHVLNAIDKVALSVHAGEVARSTVEVFYAAFNLTSGIDTGGALSAAIGVQQQISICGW